jgi:hypothetical protein
MASINITARERVTAKLREQATAQQQIAALLTGQGTTEARLHAIVHTETARLFTQLHAAVADGLLDRLDTETAVSAKTLIGAAQ